MFRFVISQSIRLHLRSNVVQQVLNCQPLFVDLGLACQAVMIKIPLESHKVEIRIVRGNLRPVVHLLFDVVFELQRRPSFDKLALDLCSINGRHAHDCDPSFVVMQRDHQ